MARVVQVLYQQKVAVLGVPVSPYRAGHISSRVYKHLVLVPRTGMHTTLSNLFHGAIHSHNFHFSDLASHQSTSTCTPNTSLHLTSNSRNVQFVA